MMFKPSVPSIQRTDGQTALDAKPTKPRDGTNGMAVIRFVQSSVLANLAKLGDITDFYMIDEEGGFPAS